MGLAYRELIKTVQQYSGFSDEEAEDALGNMVESIAVHLTESEREEFAAQLPQRLQDMALSVYPTPENSQQDIIEQFMEVQDIEESRAKKQVMAAWQTIKDFISEVEIEHIKSQMPHRVLTYLN